MSDTPGVRQLKPNERVVVCECQTAPNGKHCWHVMNNVYATMMNNKTEVCCWCGQMKSNGAPEHGRFMPHFPLSSPMYRYEHGPGTPVEEKPWWIDPTTTTLNED